MSNISTINSICTQIFGRCSAFVAELWGVVQGLRMACRMGMKRVVVESDSEKVKINHEMIV
ncbi:uncharacterized protein DS421_15g493280 [Arachis hypogaea]|nr:uncharacterized protein DS421_15g493280 [Arachis hypogaea]